MTVYKGEEVSIEVDSTIANTKSGIVWVRVDDQNVGELVNIHWKDRENFVSELTAVIEKYKI